MTDPTLAAVQQVAQDVRDLRLEVSGRMEQAVTRREHDAEIKLVRTEHQLLAERHAALEASATVEHTALREAIEADQAGRALERQRTEDARRADRRVYLAVTVGAVSAAPALASFIGRLITGA